jgi:hypothetical protein
MTNIVIFGGGISGLTIAHNMIKKGFNVTVYESESILGGMARSKRNSGTNVPTEHSWRGYAPFYYNFRNLAKEIPTETGTVLDNLSIPFVFKNCTEKRNKYKNENLSINDMFTIVHTVGKSYLSDKRNAEYHKQAITPLFKEKMSDYSFDFFIEFLMGPGWGMDKDTASVGHYSKFAILSFLNNEKKWNGMRMPTSEAWFDPWYIYLQKKGVKFIMNSSLTKINVKDNKVISCVVNENNTVVGDEYMFCINPFNLQQVLSHSGHNLRDMSVKHEMSNNNSYYEMIAFSITFSKVVKAPHKCTAYVMVDTPLNLTFYQQGECFNKDVNLGDGVKSIWSGTCIMTHRPVSLYNKNGINLTIPELKKEILHEILISEQLQDIIKDNNGFKLYLPDIKNIDIWYEWHNVNGVLEPLYKKYANNIYNQSHRLDQKTSLSNMYIAGSHTKTTIDIWSMEGAVESGIVAGNLVLEKYGKTTNKLYNHDKNNLIVNSLKNTDNILYKMGLPNVFDFLLVFIIIFYILMVIYFFTR